VQIPVRPGDTRYVSGGVVRAYSEYYGDGQRATVAATTDGYSSNQERPALSDITDVLIEIHYA
jgi:hypothetical protein